MRTSRQTSATKKQTIWTRKEINSLRQLARNIKIAITQRNTATTVRKASAKKIAANLQLLKNLQNVLVKRAKKVFGISVTKSSNGRNRH